MNARFAAANQRIEPMTRSAISSCLQSKAQQARSSSWLIPIVRPQKNMDAVTPSKTTSFSKHAARVSWICPVVTIITCSLLMVGGQIIPRRIIALIASAALCLPFIGLFLGIVALFASSKQSTRGVLVSAGVGTIINGLLLSFVVAIFISA